MDLAGFRRSTTRQLRGCAGNGAGEVGGVAGLGSERCQCVDAFGHDAPRHQSAAFVGADVGLARGEQLRGLGLGEVKSGSSFPQSDSYLKHPGIIYLFSDGIFSAE